MKKILNKCIDVLVIALLFARCVELMQAVRSAYSTREYIILLLYIIVIVLYTITKIK